MLLIRSFLLLAATAISFTGCASYPLGLSKAEWEAMSPAKQEEYRKLQSIADGQKRQDADADRRHVEQAVRSAEAK